MAEGVLEDVHIIRSDTQDQIHNEDVQELEVLNPEHALKNRKLAVTGVVSLCALGSISS